MTDLVEFDPCFEDFKRENGVCFWWASQYMGMLGYSDLKAFEKVLNRVTRALVSLDIPHYENIIPFDREENGTTFKDFKLTRFACYLAAMNANPKHHEVALAQQYFAEQTRRFELFVSSANDLDRVMIREELTEGNKALSSTAKRRGVVNYANFVDAGYRGLYNMRAGELMAKRRLPRKANLADFMGRTELAANLFRVTQAEARIQSQDVIGQQALEKTHFEVGREVRNMMQRNSGVSPENLPQERKLPQVKSEIKSGYRKMRKLDAPKPEKK